MRARSLWTSFPGLRTLSFTQELVGKTISCERRTSRSRASMFRVSVVDRLGVGRYASAKHPRYRSHLLGVLLIYEIGLIIRSNVWLWRSIRPSPCVWRALVRVFLLSRVCHTFSKSDYEKRCPAVLVRIKLYWKGRVPASYDIIQMYGSGSPKFLYQHIHCDEYVAITIWGDRKRSN